MDWKKNEQFGEKQIIKIIDLNRTKRKRADDLNKAEEIMLKTSWVTLCVLTKVGHYSHLRGLPNLPELIT